jgi:methylated-DNA-protein-cysteine methyltransferase related protein
MNGSETDATASTLGGASHETFRERVLGIVRSVPSGRVVTYGQVALLAGSPRAARQVGGVLYGTRDRDDVPWQRVVNASGGISTHKIGAGALQEALLRAEGVEVGQDGVDLARYGWAPDPLVVAGRETTPVEGD